MAEFDEHEFGRRFKRCVAYPRSDFSRADMQRFMMVVEEAKKEFPTRQSTKKELVGMKCVTSESGLLQMVNHKRNEWFERWFCNGVENEV